MSKQTVTVLLSTYNGVAYLREQLDSIVEQTHDNWTLLVRDDGSSDKTVDLVSEYVQRDSRVSLLEGRNVGVIDSFFTLLRSAEYDSEYFAFSDQDDVWKSDKLERAVDLLNSLGSEKALMYCSRQEYVNEDLRHLGLSSIPENPGFLNAIIENVATGCTVVINRAARELIISDLPQYAVMHDWWAYLVTSCFGEVIFDEYDSIKYRQHGGNQVGGSASSVERFMRRARRNLFNSDNPTNLVKQAVEFEETFGAEIPQRFREELRRFTEPRQNVFKRLSFALTTQLRRSSKVDSFLFRILYVLNRYSR